MGKNYIFGVMARMYFQPCHKPEQVLETLALIAAIDCSIG